MSTRPHVPTAPLVAVGLLGGFATADLTGSRGLGGAVLVAVGLACAALWWRARGPLVAVALDVVYLTAFVGSHPLAGVLGAWPAVLVVATAGGLVAWVVADRPARRARLDRAQRPVKTGARFS